MVAMKNVVKDAELIIATSRINNSHVAIFLKDKTTVDKFLEDAGRIVITDKLIEAKPMGLKTEKIIALFDVSYHR